MSILTTHPLPEGEAAAQQPHRAEVLVDQLPLLVLAPAAAAEVANAWQDMVMQVGALQERFPLSMTACQA